MKNNIQAFPQLQGGYKGMTLLDYFAGQELASYGRFRHKDIKEDAKSCYDYAEAMLEEREKRNEGK